MGFRSKKLRLVAGTRNDLKMLFEAELHKAALERDHGAPKTSSTMSAALVMGSVDPSADAERAFLSRKSRNLRLENPQNKGVSTVLGDQSNHERRSKWDSS
jgi:hypothetical protein